MTHSPAELLKSHVLTGDGLHHVRPGDEHVARLVHHEDEVRHRRGVDGATGTGTEDDTDLWDHARGAHVAIEDAAVAVQRDDALLDARPARVVETDDRHPDREGKVHNFVDLLGVGFTERPPEHREVLAENADTAAVDHPETRDDPVCVGAGALHAHAVRAVTHEQVHFLEGAFVEQVVDPLTGRHLALCLVRLYRPLRSHVYRLRPPRFEPGETGIHRAVDRVVLRHGAKATRVRGLFDPFRCSWP